MTYNVFGETLDLTQPNPMHLYTTMNKLDFEVID